MKKLRIGEQTLLGKYMVVCFAWALIIRSWTNKGLNLKNTFDTLCLGGWGFHVKPVFLFDIFSGDPFFDVLIMGIF